MTDKPKLLAALAIGLLAGFLLANLTGNRYSVTVLNSHTAIRTDKLTGKTWSSSYQPGGVLVWKPIETPSGR